MFDWKKYCRIDDKYVFFLKGPLSQWWKSNMIEFNIKYNCCEQYMMYQKALLFNDIISANKIIISSDPSEQKNIGRKVKNFNDILWNEYKSSIVEQGNYLKFSQNNEMKEILLATGDKILVEANGCDRIWGIGMFDDDPNLLNTELWGENLLGKALMKVREKIKSKKD